MAQLRHLEPVLAEHGARLVFVGSGRPEEACEFLRQHVGPHTLLLDPQRSAFAAAGMRRSRWTLLAPRMWRNVWRAMRAGFRQGALQGDAWQLGGVVVLGREDRVWWREIERVAGDELDLRRVAQTVADHLRKSD